MSTNEAPLKEARLEPGFLEKPTGLFLSLLIGLPLAFFTLVQTANATENIRPLGILLMIVLMMPFVLSLVFNIVFLINKRHFKKLKSKDSLSWTLPADKWMAFWEMNAKMEKQYARGMLISYMLFIPFLLIAYGFGFYVAITHDDHYLIGPFSFLFGITIIALLIIPFGFHYRGKKLLERAKKQNMTIYLNKKMVFVNGKQMAWKQFGASQNINLIRQPIPFIEVIHSNNLVNYKTLLFEKIAAHFIEKKYLRTVYTTRIPLPDDKKMISKIEEILNKY